MDPAFLSALTVTVLPDTPLGRQAERDRFQLPAVGELLGELRTFVRHTQTTGALFRTNHASNYLPLGGQLPRDRDRIIDVLDLAIAGKIPLRSEHHRGL
jgi:hypothetical protein